MDVSGWIAITVALLGIAGGIWTQLVQFKKDARRIDDVKDKIGEARSDVNDVKNDVGGVKNDVGGVKADANLMIPTLNHTDENVKKIRDYVIEKVYPSVSAAQDNSEENSEKLQRLVDELNYQQRCRQEALNTIENRNYFVAGIDNLYEKNAMLNQRVTELLHECSVCQQELHKVKQENVELRKEKLQLQKQLHSLDDSYEYE